MHCIFYYNKLISHGGVMSTPIILAVSFSTSQAPTKEK